MDKKSGKPVNSRADNFEDKINLRYEENAKGKVGNLGNIKPTTYYDKNQVERAAILCYFIDEAGEWFKALYPYEPYFYLRTEPKDTSEVVNYLNNTFENRVAQIDYVDKVDLDLPDHLSGKTQKYIKLSFKTMEDLIEIKMELKSIINRNNETIAKKKETENIFMKDVEVEVEENFLMKIIELREYDLPYYNRVCIDNEIRCSYWYDMDISENKITRLTHLTEKLDKPDLRIMAFDIETTKADLKFPDPQVDSIMMISYMIDGKGFLITNREIISEDVDDFEYTPLPEYEGHFTVFNMANEQELLLRFFDHIKETKPFIFCTFNGDYFDWPFIETRARIHGMSLEEEIGVMAKKNRLDVAYYGRFACHLDCMYWVRRDAYLPQGSQGLKKVTVAKLGYDPVELDPEKMMDFARNNPKGLAAYSVSDALATYYLYYKMIHDFIFALCTIIPSHPDDVLRKGSGTLCEELLMAQAFRGNIIFPNKKDSKFEKFYNNHLIDNDTYVGGHVEALKTGIYRSDFPQKFKVDKGLYKSLMDNVDKVIDFSITVEAGLNVEDVENREEVKQQVLSHLQSFVDTPTNYVERDPLIYHVDVSAMYPNIILSNRLQPVAIVNDEICASCSFNVEENNCKRYLDWQWKVSYYPLVKKEYDDLKKKLLQECENEKHITEEEMKKRLKARLKAYSSSVYKQLHINETVLKQDIVCMRENPFYVDTVRDFRDRRYQFKKLVKVWTANMKQAAKDGDTIEEERCKNLCTLYESLQLAHKIILNSFYGYVMRRGARWYSMEMAAIVTHTGGSIIKDARILLDQFGIPLELDTDGVWCLLPKGFPEVYDFKLKDGKTVPFEYICSMCNVLIYDKYANPQYQTLVDPVKKLYETRQEMSIFFEIDGPYKCMMLPAAKEENKMLKKRYAVFNHKNVMTEMKGFELKRRGELQIIKIFQSEVFEKFLAGKTIQECYNACGEVADQWYNILDTEGKNITDEELIDYIAESRMLSKSVVEYGALRSTSVTCAKRMAELLGEELIKDKGLNVKFLICKKPLDEPISERAIPVIVFQMEPTVMRNYIKKWCKDYSITDFDMRSMIDWNYYKDRVGSAILKIVTIPAAMQGCENPFPKVEYPDWLKKKVKELSSIFKQKKLTDFMTSSNSSNIFSASGPFNQNIEDVGKSKVRELTENEKKVLEKRKENEIKANEEKKRIEEEEKNPVSIDIDFKGWLRCQKRFWRKSRKQRKEDPLGLNNNTGLVSMMKNFDQAFLKSTLQIIQIQKTPMPGILKLWVRLANNLMYSINLKVFRKIYINSKTQQSQSMKVNKTLPRERSSKFKQYHLYQIEQEEEAFTNTLDELMHYHLSNVDIDGVYETHIPLEYRVILDSGNFIKPKSSKIDHTQSALNRTYSVDELAPVRCDNVKVFKEINKVLVYYSNVQNRHLVAVYIPSTQFISIFTVSDNKINKNLSEILLIFKKTLVDVECENEINFETFNYKHQNSIHTVFKVVDDIIKDYKSKNKAAFITVVHTAAPIERVISYGLTSLNGDVPYMVSVGNSEDNAYPALDWAFYAVSKFCQRCVILEEWFDEKASFSNYAGIPLGNLQGDTALQIIDVLYSRALQNSHHVLWYSDTTLPDLGGNEDADYRRFFDQLDSNAEMCFSGFYRTYCVEIDINLLCINAILQSDQLYEFAKKKNEKKSKDVDMEAEKLQNKMSDEIDSFESCTASFMRLRNVISQWLDDVKRGNVFADVLLSHLYRWLSSGEAKLYDPQLFNFVNNLMQICFTELLQKFKALGATLIFTSFNKIIIETKKSDIAQARNYVNFIVDSIMKESVFKYLRMNTVEEWKILLFKDRFNYGGIRETSNGLVTCQFDLKNHLPERVSKIFLTLIGEFILKNHKHNKEMKNKVIEDDPSIHQEILQLTNVSKEPLKPKEDIDPYIGQYGACSNMEHLDHIQDMAELEDIKYARNLLREDFTKKLFEIIDEISSNKSHAEMKFNEAERRPDVYDDEEYEDRKIEREAWNFKPQLGSYLDQHKPALEFIKFICKIFSLEESLENTVNIMRRGCLKKLSLGEFEKGSEYLEPSLELILPQATCANCQTTRNLDICKEFAEDKKGWA